MYVDIIDAQYIEKFILEIKFEDGLSGRVDFQQFIDRGGIFEKLRDIDYFRKFTINAELGTLTWQDEIDIAPETLYSQATNNSLPDWMNTKSELQTTA